MSSAKTFEALYAEVATIPELSLINYRFIQNICGLLDIKTKLTWSSDQTLDAADVYFFDDNGGVRVPASYRLQYWNGTSYVDVASGGNPVAVNQYNRVTFSQVSTTRLRVVLQSGAGSVGLLEVKAYGP